MLRSISSLRSTLVRSISLRDGRARPLSTGTKSFDNREHGEEDVYFHRKDAELLQRKHAADTSILMAKRRDEVNNILGIKTFRKL